MEETQKIKNQIEKLQKYLLTFGGNTSKVVMKQYAIKKKINTLKDKIGDTSPTYVLGCTGPIVAR
ncbi:MAG: hypothetical protein CMP21_03410 [Rickettsiales bacterium]|nr:hypothetical protein [Rickettsiales bacterium]